VSDHLATCSGCRAEEQHYRSIMKGEQELNTFRVSEGFNNRLLDRIAHERFAETRTKAYFPKPAPSILFRRVIPVVVTAFLAVAVVITNYSPDKIIQLESFAAGEVQLDDAYLTAQPVNNPNLTSTLRQGWTLDDQLARSDRINRISQQLTFAFPFDCYYQGNAVNVSTRSSRPVPYVDGFYRIRPVITVFESANPNANKEAAVTY
jgi:hypothetical protein